MFIDDDKIYISVKHLWQRVTVLQAPKGTPEIVFLDWDNETFEEESDHPYQMSQADANAVEDVFGVPV